MKRILAVTFALVVGLAPVTMAQGALTGNVYGSVADESGALLPGATVSISGVELGGTRTATTGGQGDFRFLSLDPGKYKLTVALAGFATVAREVRVNTGVNVNLTFSLKVSAIEETVTVTAETPIVDTKKFGTQTTVTNDELGKIPGGRDPWAVLQTIPGVIVDRVNIAGSESGQQSNFAAKGAGASQNVWNVDGVNITDMSALGASPTYYDIDAFQEINVSTGANDIKSPTGGIQLNFVTKRGTNKFHATARGFFTGHDLEGNNLEGSGAEARVAGILAGNPSLTQRYQDEPKANSIDQVSDYGFEIGGPVVKDKLWFWGSYARNDIRVKRLNQTQDRTILVDYNGKLTWQAGANDTVNASWFYGSKLKYGRLVGWGINEEQSSTWDQGNKTGSFKPGLYRVEWNHVFSPNFFGNLRYGFYNTGFFLHSKGENLPPAIDFNEGTTRGGAYYNIDNTRPQQSVYGDFNYFANGMGGQHELKFGFGYRHNPSETITAVNGPQRIATFEYGPGTGYAEIWRDSDSQFTGDYTSAYLGDTFTKDRLTLNVGVRFDHQVTSSPASSTPANPAFPSLLPAVDAPAVDGVTWNDITPRVGLTYALDESRKTVARASYARYASQMVNTYGLDKSGAGYAYIGYYWQDLNGDHFAQIGEIDTATGPVYYSSGFDPSNPANGVLGNTFDPDFSSQKDNEFIVGLDRELAANFAVGAAFTYRRGNNFGFNPRTNTSGGIMTRSDYTCGAPVRQSVSGLTSAGVCNPNLAIASGSRTRTNLKDYYTDYKGFEFSATKRLSSKWMGRLAVTYADWREHFQSENARVQSSGNPTPTRTDPLIDGGLVAPRGSGSGKQIFYSANWQVTANALYQLPWNTEISANMLVRQGYPMPFYVARGSGDGTQYTLAVNEIDQFRLDNVFNLDMRLAKSIKFGDGSLTVMVDAFNVLNKNTVLERGLAANSAAAYRRVEEILNPRVFRIGARLGF